MGLPQEKEVITMLSEKYVLDQLKQLSSEDQVERLLEALKILKNDKDRSITACIAMSINIPVFPKVSQILERNGRQLTLLFTHGEERVIDFQAFFSKESRYQKILLEDIHEFNKVQVDYDTLTWPELGFWDKDFEGNEVFHNYDIDPGMLYEASEPLKTEPITG